MLSLPQTLFRESVAGAGFQVTFESERGAFIFEGNVALDTPWAVHDCGRIAAVVVIAEPLAEIFREADVTLHRSRDRDEAVNVKHSRSFGDPGEMTKRHFRVYLRILGAWNSQAGVSEARGPPSLLLPRLMAVPSEAAGAASTKMSVSWLGALLGLELTANEFGHSRPSFAKASEGAILRCSLRSQMAVPSEAAGAATTKVSVSWLVAHSE